MAFCANCGASVNGRFCQKCGASVADPGAGFAPPPPPPPPSAGGYPQVNPPPAPGAAAGMTDNMAGALCYLFGFITGILFLVLAPYNQNREIRFHAFQSIFWNLAMIGCWIVFAIVARIFLFIPILGALVAFVLYAVLGLGGFLIWLFMMFKTYNGEKILLPIVGPIAEKQAGA
jgi:uncharacterized membrane protein